jgi:hypothetical protein
MLESDPSCRRARQEFDDDQDRQDRRAPAHELHSKVRKLFSQVESFCHALDWAVSKLSALDSCARHDQPIDDESWQVLARNHPRSSLYSHVLRELRNSAAALESANRSIQGRFRGEAKNKVEGLMTRHLAMSEQLLQLFQGLKEVELETPHLPYQIRQAELTPLVDCAREVADALTELYRTAAKDAAQADLLQAILKEQQSALQVRATLAKLRDNPSQKVGPKLQTCLDKMTGARTGLLLVVQQVAERNELCFVNRAGRIISFRETFFAYENGLSA